MRAPTVLLAGIAVLSTVGCGPTKTDMIEVDDASASRPLDGSAEYIQAVRCVGLAESVQMATANTPKADLGKFASKVIRGAQSEAARLGQIEKKVELRVMTDVAGYQATPDDLGGQDLFSAFQDKCGKFATKDTLAPKE